MIAYVVDLLWRLFSSRWLVLVVLSVLLCAIALALIFPQMPQGLREGSSEQTQWLANIRARYLRWADPLQSLGLFSIRDTFWLRAPLALLAVGLAVCGVEHLGNLRRSNRLAREGEVSPFPRVSQSSSLIRAGDPEPTIQRVQELLQGLGYRVRAQRKQAATYLIGDRFAWARWGTVFAHAGALLLVIGLIVGARVAWSEPDIALVPGQAYAVRHSESISVRLDEFRPPHDSGPGGGDYTAAVAIVENDQDVTTGIVVPGAPLWYRGMFVYLSGQGPLIYVSAQDTQGQPLPLQALAPSGRVMEEVVLQFSDQDNEGYVAVPERNLVLRLVLQPTEAKNPQLPPSFLWEAYQAGSTEVLFRTTMHGSGSVQIDGDTYFAEWGEYAILSISGDPSIGLLAVGAIVLLTGSTLALLLRPRLIWVSVHGGASAVRVQVFNPGWKDNGLDELGFQKLVTEIEEGLGAS
jgi:cytochrome c biogenesis protein ResB